MQISIHAPRGGSDLDLIFSTYLPFNFNPRSPWGERPIWVASSPSRVLFQSTLPVGGATRRTWAAGASRSISIHAPRGGSDGVLPFFRASISNFNPRSPWGERHGRTMSLVEVGRISIHAPRGGSDRGQIVWWSESYIISIHAPRGGSDTDC